MLIAICRRGGSKEVAFVKRMLQVVLEEDLRKQIIHQLFLKYATSDEAGFSKDLYVDTNMLKTMKSEKMHIGSHGYNHYWLWGLSKEKQEVEIKKQWAFY